MSTGEALLVPDAIASLAADLAEATQGETDSTERFDCSPAARRWADARERCHQEEFATVLGGFEEEARKLGLNQQAAQWRTFGNMIRGRMTLAGAGDNLND